MLEMVVGAGIMLVGVIMGYAITRANDPKG